MAIEVTIKGGVKIIVDECDLSIAEQPGWLLGKSGRVVGHFKVNGTRRALVLSRVIVSSNGNSPIFHINGDRLDFRRANLREGRCLVRDPFLDRDGIWKIPLSRGRFALIDEQDVDRVKGHLWFVFGRDTETQTPHVARFEFGVDGRRQVWLHREVLGVADGPVVDHINRDGLDNRRANLRLATTSQNAANRQSAKSSSGYRGVRRQSGASGYRAQITVNGVAKHMGGFSTPEQAAAAYDRAAIDAFGEFAVLNFPHLNSSPCAARLPDGAKHASKRRPHH